MRRWVLAVVVAVTLPYASGCGDTAEGNLGQDMQTPPAQGQTPTGGAASLQEYGTVYALWGPAIPEADLMRLYRSLESEVEGSGVGYMEGVFFRPGLNNEISASSTDTSKLAPVFLAGIREFRPRPQELFAILRDETGEERRVALAF